MYDIDHLFSRPDKSKAFITAEIGINHLGNFDLAKKMIESAKQSGADAVKFQVFNTDLFYHPVLAKAGFDLFKTFELSFDQYQKLKEFSDSLDLFFYATPFDTNSLDFLVSIGVKLIKIASSDITNEPFLNQIRDKSIKNSLKICLSTGFVDLQRIKKAISLLNNTKTALLYCVSKYPTTREDFDLNFITHLKKQFKAPIGFSDHSLDNYFSFGAISLGAKLIERHFTTDNNINGGDNPISLNPQKFKELVTGSREIEAALGEGNKKISDFEKQITTASMRDIYAARSISQGEIIQEEDLIMLRPGKGVSLKDIKNLIGKKSKRNIEKYEKI